MVDINKETYEVWLDYDKDFNKVAELYGVTPRAIRYRIERFKNNTSDKAQEEDVQQEDSDFTIPDLPSTRMETTDLIDHLTDRFRTRQAAAKARDWFKIKINLDGPYALAFMGDPHMDDNGCNWPQLVSDMDTISNTEAMWSVGLGDYTNNWIGRLNAKKYPEQEATKTQGWQLCEWFFGAKKPNGSSQHILLIKGNHDMWSGCTDPLNWISSRTPAPLEDWEAKVRFVSPNGVEIPMWIAHNFKGHSMWNPLHGNLRKAHFNGEAKVYVCGDKHIWSCTEIEDQDRPGNIYWLARARGYKYIDGYARDLGYGSQQYGATVTAVVDPNNSGPQQIRLYPCVQEAADFLSWKRKKKC